MKHSPVSDATSEGEYLFARLMTAIHADPQMGPRLREIDAFEAEVKAAVEHVMLDIAFSPVILKCGGSIEDAVEVEYKAEDGRYIIKEPFCMLTEDETKLARARFLIARGKAMAPQMERFKSSFR